ncbi:MAG: hypothetical protein CSA22_05835 [Deltaproteobacteria bacterium]|nr:MAG: hypothetical protein CSA22_05835 [Deltaproteobacteria bacterium]
MRLALMTIGTKRSVDFPKFFILNRLVFKRACGSIHLTRLLFLTCLLWVKHNMTKQGGLFN